MKFAKYCLHIGSRPSIEQIDRHANIGQVKASGAVRTWWPDPGCGTVIRLLPCFIGVETPLSFLMSTDNWMKWTIVKRMSLDTDLDFNSIFSFWFLINSGEKIDSFTRIYSAFELIQCKRINSFGVVSTAGVDSYALNWFKFGIDSGKRISSSGRIICRDRIDSQLIWFWFISQWSQLWYWDQKKVESYIVTGTLPFARFGGPS